MIVCAIINSLKRGRMDMIKTYLELKEQLESYEGILDPRIIKYFND